MFDSDPAQDRGVLEAARAIRPYLPDLVGPASDRVDREIAILLAAEGRGEDIANQMRALLDADEVTADFVAEVLDDAPHYRPPDRQPDTLRGVQRLPGDVGPVLHAGRFACPHGDYVWYRPAVSVSTPPCPTHGAGLVRG